MVIIMILYYPYKRWYLVVMLHKGALFVVFQVQIYELEEHKIETWRGENVS